MKKTGMAKSLVLASLMVAGAGSAVAQDKSGYVRDSQGQIVKSGYGLCWRTGYWTPAMALPECDPTLVGKAAPAKAAQMSLSADGLFEFGKAVLQPGGKASLDGLAEKLKGKKIQRMDISGHTDRIGSAESNKTLSARRAQAVKDYLVSKGLEAKAMKAVGKGSAQPKTTKAQCPGTKKDAKLIECLAPDRRVDIDVSYM